VELFAGSYNKSGLYNIEEIIQSLTSNFVLIKHMEYFSILIKNIVYKKKTINFLCSLMLQHDFLI